MTEKTQMTIDLKFPIEVTRDDKKQKITSLTFGRLKAKHLRHMPEDPENFKPHEVVPLIGAMAGLSEEEAGELDLADLMEAATKLVPLFVEFQVTGEKSSGE